MKNLFMFFAVAFSFMFVGCGQSASDIKLSDLDAACDYVEAFNIVADEMIEMEETYESYSDLSDEEKEHACMLKGKLRDIKKAAKKKYTRAELEECEGFEALQEKM